MSKDSLKLRERSKTRKENAEERRVAYDKLTTKEKLERALARGHSGTREVKRLRAQLDKESQDGSDHTK